MLFIIICLIAIYIVVGFLIETSEDNSCENCFKLDGCKLNRYYCDRANKRK